MLDRRSLVQAPSAPRDQSQHPRARNDYDEETAYEGYMNPEPGFQSGPGDSAEADSMAPCLLVTKSSPPSGGLRKKNQSLPHEPAFCFVLSTEITIQILIPAFYPTSSGGSWQTQFTSRPGSNCRNAHGIV